MSLFEIDLNTDRRYYSYICPRGRSACVFVHCPAQAVLNRDECVDPSLDLRIAAPLVSVFPRGMVRCAEDGAPRLIAAVVYCT